jgi:hypothetical protein
MKMQFMLTLFDLYSHVNYLFFIFTETADKGSKNAIVLLSIEDIKIKKVGE